MIDLSERCENCKFWMAQGPNGGMDPKNLKAPAHGMCRRFPPTSQVIGMQPHPLDPKVQVPQFTRSLPQVFGPEWCGEWRIATMPLPAPGESKN